ncbi:unnamed protein product [Arctia plantaginis]|uniref:C-type lectin domain-containing protein n=1 Tax=Arctia plantaginis TaxID=874455 RepID=A0A8S1A3V8_ARCPL|nr:unnamed protein product [Arctia plantaginis]
MLKQFIVLLFLSISCSVAYKSDYEYHPDAGAWFKLHRVTATWQQAFFRCHNEGALLASPTTEKMLRAMQRLLQDNRVGANLHYIGTHSKFSPGHFVALEGTPIENMPVMDMVDILNTQDGDCLTMTDTVINVNTCMKELPYICYRTQEMSQNNTECGTFDEDYQLDASTGSCYKIHTKPRTWSDANSMCVTEGGSLAVLNDEEEARIIQKMFPKITMNSTEFKEYDSLYIGLQDWDGSGTWLSIRGEPIQELYNNWNKPKPTYEAFDEYCGVITSTGKIDNIGCDRLSVFVCEKDPDNVRYSVEHQEQDNE